MKTVKAQLSHGELLQLARWNTPTIYNGWEQITCQNPGTDGFNLEETCDFMPQMGPMVGYAITVVIEPSNSSHRSANPAAWSSYRRYVAEAPGPKIVVVQDLDKPRVVGSFWGEVNSGIHRALGCIGTITDGAIRDADEMNHVGFKALARRLCVGHAFSHPVRWDCEVDVFGRKVRPCDLIHADKHGFLVIPPEDQANLLAAAKFLDATECSTLINAARGTAGKEIELILRSVDAAAAEFDQTVRRKGWKSSEWNVTG
jgi:4-hydroxy-4-methyl-2-oxoglutarate aldolase